MRGGGVIMAGNGDAMFPAQSRNRLTIGLRPRCRKGELVMLELIHLGVIKLIFALIIFAIFG